MRRTFSTLALALQHPLQRDLRNIRTAVWRRVSFTAPGADSLRFQKVPILVAPEISARA